MILLLAAAFANPTVLSGPVTAGEQLRRAAQEQGTLVGCFDGDDARVDLTVVVDPSGAVKKAKAKGGPKAVRKCLQAGLKGLSLPPSDEPVQLVWEVDVAQLTERGGGVLGALSAEGLEPAGIGGLIGARGTQIGSGGLGSRGSGLGAGGTNSGLGGLGTRGTGSGPPTESHIADPTILGSLKRAHMDEVVQAAWSDILACPTEGQQGKVVVKFTVASDGSVSAAQTTTSTFGAHAVEDCIEDVIRGLVFDGPEGGGIVIARYPFLFAAEE